MEVLDEWWVQCICNRRELTISRGGARICMECD